MPQQEFEIAVTESSVDARLELSSKSRMERFYMGLFYLAILALGVCAIVFLPGKFGQTSMWHDLSTSPIDSADFRVPAGIILIFVLFMGFMFVRYLVAAYPADQALHCDRSTLTVSRTLWLDVNNRNWITQSYALKELSRIRFDVIASTKGSSTYGIRFFAAGKSKVALPGIEAREAAEILKALKAMGADVVDG